MKKFLKIARIVAMLLVAYVGFQFLFTGIVFVIEFLKDLDLLVDPNVEEPPTMSMNHVLSIGLFLSAIAMFLFINYTKTFRFRMSLFTSIAIKPLLLSTALVFTSMFALNVFVQWLQLEDINEKYFAMISRTFVGAFTISVLAPILEEVMFRGAIQGCMLRNLRSPWLAIIASALIFGIFHMNPIQIVYATLLGIILGWMYYRTGSLMSVIVGHVLNNTLATISNLYLGTSNETEVLNSYLPPTVVICIQVATFLFFATLSVFIAVKLNKSMPPAPSPWHESDEPAPVNNEISD